MVDGIVQFRKYSEVKLVKFLKKENINLYSVKGVVLK